MRNVWVLVQLGGLLLLLLSLAGGFSTFGYIRGHQYQLVRIMISVFMVIASIGGIFLIVFGGIKYRQESRKIKKEGKSSSNPLL